ncbi:MAG: hypothetical protein EOP84_21880 [Verrucomicrobiaceae bacterium]|nr:MAG: hypothetical protein EOP84_21880 [Verrucomicrobiaceae bacterium]
MPIDGTKVLANANKHLAVSYGKAGEKMRDLELEIAELVRKAEDADSIHLEDGAPYSGGDPASAGTQSAAD